MNSISYRNTGRHGEIKILRIPSNTISPRADAHLQRGLHAIQFSSRFTIIIIAVVVIALLVTSFNSSELDLVSEERRQLAADAFSAASDIVRFPSVGQFQILARLTKQTQRSTNAATGRT